MSFYNFDSWYEDLKAIHTEFVKERAKIDWVRLSPAGQSEELGKVIAEKNAKLDQIEKKFKNNMARLERDLKAILEPSSPEKTDTEKLLDGINRLSFLMQIANMDRKELADLLGRLVESEDMAALESLREATRFRNPDLSTASSEFIKQIREKNYSPEQREAAGKLQELEREIQLFSYSLQNLRERHEYVDVRGGYNQDVSNISVEGLKAMGVNVISGGKSL